jgi:hypothetical protein
VTPHRVASRLLVALCALLLAGAATAGYADRVLFDGDRFAARTTTALQDPDVRTVIADRVTDQLVLRNRPDLLTARPLISGAVSGLVGGQTFATIVRAAARDAHRAVFDRDQDTLTLTLADAGAVVAAALRTFRPELADELEDERVVLVRERLGTVTGDLARFGERARLLGWLLLALAGAAAAGAVVLARDKRRSAAQLGLAVLAAGLLVVLATAFAKAIALAPVDGGEDRAAARAIWDAYLGDLTKLGLLLAACGAVVAAAASSLIPAVELDLRAAWARVTARAPVRWLALARGVVLVVLGGMAIADPLGVLRLAITLAGLAAVYSGLVSLLRLIHKPPEQAADRSRSRRRAALVTAVAVAALIVAGAAATFVATGGLSEPVADAAGRCNGHTELCDRPLDEVAVVATHNAMSVPLPGWFAALQERPIPGQLEDGVRGLLLDTHYGDLLPNGRVRTDFGGPAGLQRAIAQDGVGEADVQAALRLRERLGFRGEGERGIYLCHAFCELGFTAFAEVLGQLRDFLATHPGEVVVVINQDAVTPPDVVAAADDAGLAPFMATPPAAGARWPTLGEMVASGRRLVMLAENDAGAAPWYQLVYERLVQETPFMFGSTADLTEPGRLPASCRDNRGVASAPLFLLNHWVNTDPRPLPRNAATVNAYGPLLRRARECQRIRGRTPNLLAVDFYRRGDAFRVADTLNGM